MTGLVRCICNSSTARELGGSGPVAWRLGWGEPTSVIMTTSSRAHLSAACLAVDLLLHGCQKALRSMICSASANEIICMTHAGTAMTPSTTEFRF